MIIQGDLSQCDKYKTNGITAYEKSGFYDVWFRLKGLEGVNHMEFSRDDCIRHPLVKRILKKILPFDGLLFLVLIFLKL